MFHVPAHKSLAAPAGQFIAYELDDMDADPHWDGEMDTLAWAEAGGYSAGLARPVSKRPPAGDYEDWEDIDFWSRADSQG